MSRRKGSKGNKNKTSLGNNLIKSRNKKKANRRIKLADRKARASGVDAETGNYVDYGGMTGLTSVTELSSLDEFISHARMADRSFATERNNVVVVPDTMIGGDATTLGRASAVNKGQLPINAESLKIPRRPAWNATTTKEQLDKAERTAFLAWRRSIAELEERMRQEEQKCVVTPFEKNIEFWRQLWRVMERSDLVVQIVDARNPLMFYSPDLVAYADELSIRFNKVKKTMLVVNKADYLSIELREQWAKYFQSKNINFCFFSALEEQAVVDAEEQALVAATIALLHPERTLDLDLSADLGGVVRVVGVGEGEGEGEEGEVVGKVEQVNIAEHDTESKDESGQGVATEEDQQGEQKTTQNDYGNNDYEHRSKAWMEQGVSKNARLLNRHELVARIDQIAQQVALANTPVTVVSETSLSDDDAVVKSTKDATVGMVGYPNVGKSSVINVLLGVTSSTHTKQRVGVGATPGKTKHFQTLKLKESLTLCDCPGLVFPSFVASKAEMVCNGVLPIAQMRDCMSPITLLCNRIRPETWETTYKILLPRSIVNGKRLPYGARELLQLYSTRRGYMRSGHGGPDEPRGARDILKDYVCGKLLYCLPPPSLTTADTTTSTGHKTIVASSGMAETSAQARPRLVVGGHLVTRDELAMKELDAQQQTEFSEQEMEERMQAMKIAMAQAAAAATDTGDAVDGDSKMAVVAANTDVATGAVTHTENDFDDDFFAITGEEVELKEQHVKKPHRSFNRLKGKHKARRARDSEFPTPYENNTSRTGGEDIYGLNADGSVGAERGSNINVSRGKKKQNRKFKRNNRTTNLASGSESVNKY